MRRFFATILYLCFGLPLTLAALFMLASRPWILDRGFYKRLVTDESLYVALRAPGLAQGAEARLRVGELTLNGPALVAAAQKNLPVSEMKAFASKSVDAVLDAVEGKAGPGGGGLDLKPAKAALETRREAIARDYAAALPVASALPSPGDLSFRPDSQRPERAAEAASSALKASIAKIPDLVPLAAPREGRGAPAFLGQASVNRATVLLSALSAILLGGLAWLAGRDLGTRFLRAGRYLLPPSLVVLAVGLVLYLPGAAILQGVAPHSIRISMGSAGGEALRSWIAGVLGLVSRSFLATGLIGASLAGALISLRRAFEAREY